MKSFQGYVQRLVLLLTTAVTIFAGPAIALDAGEAAPTFTAPSLSGAGELSLAQFRGKVVFVDIWASWCGPCLKSLPHLDDLRKSYPSAKFQVLAVNVDRDPAKARAFLKKRPVGYPSVSDPEGHIPKRFGLETMPTSYLVDARGVVRFVNEGFRKSDVEKLRKNIDSLLAGGR